MLHFLLLPDIASRIFIKVDNVTGGLHRAEVAFCFSPFGLGLILGVQKKLI